MSHIELAKEAITQQAKALIKLAEKLPNDFDRLVNYIIKLQGRVILTGMGKSSYMAKKIAASFASTGTPSFFIHPGEASHGDLGMITPTDLVIMLSNSGETSELFDIITYCKYHKIKIAAITTNKHSKLAISSDFLLKLPKCKETSSVSAPTTSSLLSLALGHALVTSVHEANEFSHEDFKLLHPGGKIGTQLLKVSELMKIGNELPLLQAEENFTDLIIKITEKSLGCGVVVNNEQEILGIITDGDLRRNINNNLALLTAQDIMTSDIISIKPSEFARKALLLMNKLSITMLPVSEDNKKITGLIHIHDIIRSGVT